MNFKAASAAAEDLFAENCRLQIEKNKIETANREVISSLRTMEGKKDFPGVYRGELRHAASTLMQYS